VRHRKTETRTGEPVIVNAESIPPGETLSCDVCVVGAGAAGITAALELAKSGVEVVLVEGGGMKWNARCQNLYKGTVLNPDVHARLDEYRHRRLGGTTTVWGGRCIPFDNIDFECRDYVPYSGWPITLNDLERYYQRAHEYCDCGDYAYRVREALPGAAPDMIPGLPDGEVVTSVLERFSLPTNFGAAYFTALNNTPHLRVLLNANCLSIGVTQNGGRVSHLELASFRKNQVRLEAKAFVLAAGGLEVTRLLLSSNQVHKHGIGNHSGWLGRCYMSHLSGNIGEITVVGHPGKVIFGYELDPTGVYCRRRFYIADHAQRKLRILNIAVMLDNPPMHDPSHRNGVLSLVFCAKRLRGIRTKIAPEYSKYLTISGTASNVSWSHMRNVLCGIPEIIAFLPEFAYKRIIRKRKIPSVVLENKANVYSLHYHAEQAPNPDSRVCLSTERDTFGVPRLLVDYRISDIDVESIYRAHTLIDQELRKHQCGYFTFSTSDVITDIRKQVGVGGHHIGTTRMSREASHGVVDSNCQVYGIRNLFIASSSVFPTSSQANPTLTIVAIAARVADHLKHNLQTL
jgi:choline dehydrogenase-like flavoprotein